MRPLTDREQIEKFISALGREAKSHGRVYITGGACAVLLGWRKTTIDIDLKAIPDDDHLLRAISELKVKLNVNVEMASPDDFIPELPAWNSRSSFIAQKGKLSFYHYDFYSQALAKIKRGHAHDWDDVFHMIDHGHVDPSELLEFFKKIEPWIFRYPAIDRTKFRSNVAKFLKEQRKRQRGG